MKTQPVRGRFANNLVSGFIALVVLVSMAPQIFGENLSAYQVQD